MFARIQVHDSGNQFEQSKAWGRWCPEKGTVQAVEVDRRHNDDIIISRNNDTPEAVSMYLAHRSEDRREQTVWEHLWGKGGAEEIQGN